MGWILVAAVLIAVPFTFHKLVSPRLPGFAATLPLPIAAGALLPLLMPLLPAYIDPHFDFSQMFVYWFATIIVWMWQHEFPAQKIGLVTSGFFTVRFTVILVMLIGSLSSGNGPRDLPIPTGFALLFLLGAAALAIWPLVQPLKQRTWADRSQAVALLQSPNTGQRLQLFQENGRDQIGSPSGERFPIHAGFPTFIKPQELTGSNLKYYNLYEMIGGFYTDFQRVALGLRGLNREAWYRSCINLLEVKPGDSILETSIGTGLNFKYLPKQAQGPSLNLVGLDLSTEMLINCQANLHHWKLDASLFVANAENLPFADSSFDVVFHTGGINFFNDPAKAIDEMIRVAKPGSLLLIADQATKLSEKTIENILGRFSRAHREPVIPPLHLIPQEMLQVQPHQLRNGQFYAITFRKPAQA
jgi:ubiquinone/menaquinone biosynthesis C-methylase UbiE